MFYVYADGKSIYYPMDETLLISSPRMTLEQGKAGTFEFSLPSNNRYYNLLQRLKTRITVEIDGTEIFRGRVFSEERDFQNTRRVICEGDLAYLTDSVQKGERYVGTTHDLFRKIIAAHNARVEEEKRFEVGIIDIEDREVVLAGQSDETEDLDTDLFDYKQIAINSIVNQWKTTYDYIQTCLIDYCGGYLRTRHENGITYIDLLEEFGSVSSQRIEFGINLLDLSENATAEELFTVLIPLGDDNMTIESVNGGSDELVDADLVELYGRIVKTHVFSNVTDPSTLLENGLRFLAARANVPTTLTLRAVDMHLLDYEIPGIQLGDSVPVKSTPHGIEQSLTCTKIEYDFENPANCQFTFGTPHQTLTERYRKDRTASEEENSDANAAAASAAGAAGGRAGAAAAEKAANEMQEKIYDAWINVDPELGHVDLGALYQELKDTKVVLENQVGIELDAPSGNVNIKSLKKKSDEQENTLLEQAARIEMINDDNHARIELVAARTTALEANTAEIVMQVNDLESTIALKADKVTINSKITTINSEITNINSEITNLKTLVAEKVSAEQVESALTEALTVKALNINGARITALRIDSGLICQGGEEVATQTWVESLIESKLSNYARKSHVHSWNDLSGKPVRFAPTSHTHSFSGSTTIGIGHTHYVSAVQSNTGGMSTNYTKTVSISGTTGSN